MKKFSLIIFLLWISATVFAQPTNKVYWVGPTTGANLTDSYWSATSGGTPGVYPNNTDYQLIFDGAGTSSQTYTLNLNTTTGGFIYVTNNATVTLQENSTGSLTISGIKVDVASKLIFYALGGGLDVNFPSSAPVYNGTIDGELIIKAPQLTNSCPYNGSGLGCFSATLNLSNLMVNSFTTRVITVNGTLRLEGTKSMIHVSSDCLYFAANSNLVVNAELADAFGTRYDPTSTITITGASLPDYPGPGAGFSVITLPAFGNIIYDCPGQLNNRTLFTYTTSVVKGNLIIKNTGSGTLALTAGIVNSPNAAGNLGNLILQGSPTVTFYRPGLSGNTAATLTATTIDIQGGQLDLSDGGTSTATATLAVQGNLTNQGIIKVGSTGKPNSEIDFAGTATQTVIPGTINDDPISFKINNPAGIILNSNWALPNNINSKLLLTNGNINIGANTLTVQNPLPGAIVGGSAASHIIGKLRRVTNTGGGVYVFPIDNSSTESANVRISPAGSTTTTYEVSFARPNPYDRNALPSGVIYAGNYYWDINRMSGTENANLTFVYGSNNFSSDVPGSQVNYRVLHWNGSSWDNLGGFGLSGEITASNVSTFSPFTIGTINTVLPVQLINFSGVVQNSTNVLTWSVTTEINTSKYEIERSNNGRDFQFIGKVDAIGNQNYTYSDKQPLATNNFYRLRIVDNDGKVSYSQVIILKSIANTKMEVFPNPALNIINVEYTATDNKLFIQDETGRLVKTIAVTQSGQISITIDISNLAKGIYFIKAGSESTQFVKK